MKPLSGAQKQLLDAMTRGVLLRVERMDGGIRRSRG